MKQVAILIFFCLLAANIPAQTVFSPEAGMYTNLLNDLKKSLCENKRIQTVNLDGKDRRMFVEWIRDHIHTMKAYKYWDKDLASYLAFFLNRQTPSGM